jgi:hypothetical protein
MAKPASGQRTARGPVMIGAAGLLFTLLAAGFVLMNSSIGIKTGDPAQPSLTFVDKNDLSAAASTLTPSTAGALIEDAQRCRIPLVSMTIQKGTAPIGSTIRIRSGSYLSPYFTITEAMQRIAIPYPAPYGSGAGTFVIEGTAQGAIIGLTPTKVMVDLPGMQTIPVVWRAVSPC